MCMYIYKYIHIYVYIYIYICIRLHVCMYVWMYVPTGMETITLVETCSCLPLLTLLTLFCHNAKHMNQKIFLKFNLSGNVFVEAKRLR